MTTETKTEMTNEAALDIVIDFAARWGENFEEQFTKRPDANTTDEECAAIAEASKFDDTEEDHEVRDIRDLWRAIELLRGK